MRAVYKNVPQMLFSAFLLFDIQLYLLFFKISIMSLKGFSLASMSLWKMFFGESMPHLLLLLLLLGAVLGKGHGLQENLKQKFMKWWEDSWKGIGRNQALDSALLNSLWRSLSNTLSSFPVSGKVCLSFLYYIVLFCFLGFPDGNRQSCYIWQTKFWG